MKELLFVSDVFLRAAEGKEGDSSLEFRMAPTAVMTSFPTTAVHCHPSSILMPA